MKALENAFTQNACWICDKAIQEVRKASRIDVGMDLSVIAHDACLRALEAEMTPESNQAALLHKGGTIPFTGVGGASTKRDGYSYVNEGYLRDYDKLQEQYQTALNGIVSKHRKG